MPKSPPLDTFGRFLMVHLRDRGLDRLDGLLVGRWKAPSLKKLQAGLRRLPKESASTRAPGLRRGLG